MRDQEFESPDAALKHFGVKGMKWGVRKESDDSSSKGTASVAVTKTAQVSAVTGAAAVGRMLGGAAGSAVLGPGVGTMVGQYAGGYIGGRVAGNAIVSKQKQAKTTALKDVSKAVPNRNSKYTDNMVKKDINLWGADSAKRINAAMNSGLSRKDSLSAESKLQSRSSLIAVGVSIAGPMLAGSVGRTSVNAFKTSTTARANANRAARTAANQNAVSRGLPSAAQLIKNRKGVYNITSL